MPQDTARAPAATHTAAEAAGQRLPTGRVLHQASRAGRRGQLGAETTPRNAFDPAVWVTGS